jgi:hypothetical protein
MNTKRIHIVLVLVALIAVIATSAYSAKADDDDRRRKIVGTWICNVHEGSPDPFRERFEIEV